MKPNIFDVFDRLKKVRENKENVKRQDKLKKESANRIEDLFNRFHTVGKVKLEIPNLFAQTQIEKYFQDNEEIDLNKPEHLAAYVFFFKNQKDTGIAKLTRDQIHDKIIEVMAEIPMEQIDEYAYCVHEILLAIKKKNIRFQTQILEECLAMVQGGQNAGGVRSSSH